MKTKVEIDTRQFIIDAVNEHGIVAIMDFVTDAAIVSNFYKLDDAREMRETLRTFTNKLAKEWDK